MLFYTRGGGVLAQSRKDAQTLVRGVNRPLKFILGGCAMDFSTVIQAIGTLGFPIVACCALYYANLKNEEQHKEEQEKIVEALNNNTIALTKLSERIGGSSNEN